MMEGLLRILGVQRRILRAEPGSIRPPLSGQRRLQYFRAPGVTRNLVASSGVISVFNKVSETVPSGKTQTVKNSRFGSSLAGFLGDTTNSGVIGWIREHLGATILLLSRLVLLQQ